MNQKWKGTFALLGATLIWGSTFVAQSVSTDYMGPFTFQMIRCLLAVIGLMPVIWLFDRRQNRSFLSGWCDKKLWKAGLLCGIPLFLASNLQQMGLGETDAGKSAFLTAMYIVLVPVLGIFLKKKPTVMTAVSVVLAVGGLYCLSCVGVTRIRTGDLMLIGCALAFAVQILCVDYFVAQVDPLRLNTVQALVCSLISAGVALFGEALHWSSIRQCWFPLCYAGFLSMGAAYSLQIVGQKYMEPTSASIIMSLESVFAVLFGCLLLRETMSAWEILGCILMFLAVLLSQAPVKPSRHTKRPRASQRRT